MKKSNNPKSDLGALIRAKVPVIWIRTGDEARAERAVIETATQARFDVRLWDCARGTQQADGEQIDKDATKIDFVLNDFASRGWRGVLIVRDIHRWLASPVNLRIIRNLARTLKTASRDKARALVCIVPADAELPADLREDVAQFDWPIPERPEVEAIIRSFLDRLPEGVDPANPIAGTLDQAIDAALGLSGRDIEQTVALSLVKERRIDPALIADEKRQVVAREGLLRWIDADPRGLDAIGGNELLKDWCRLRRAALTSDAREYGLPIPRGVLLGGVPGCGKSLAAKCLGAAYQIPTLQLDLGSTKSMYVGQSEQKLRQALALADSIAPCVLWVDELEKALAGSTGPQGDGGVSSDQLGALLGWMQDHTKAVFVVATCNQMMMIPPELLRRFDERFFVDLPHRLERIAVLQVTMLGIRRDPTILDLEQIADATVDFTGSEIANLVTEALYAAYADSKREIETADLLNAAALVTPLAHTMREKIDELRQWTNGRARPASAIDTPRTSAPVDREMDMAAIEM